MSIIKPVGGDSTRMSSGFGLAGFCSELLGGFVELVTVVADLLDETPGLLTGDTVLIREVIDLIAFIPSDAGLVSFSAL